MRILIVEDDFLLAISLEQSVMANGHDIAGTAGSMADAKAVLDSQAVDLVLLDRKLSDGAADPLAQELAARGTLFIWMTGYDAGEFDPVGAPVLTKPVDDDALTSALCRFDAGPLAEPGAAG